MQRVGLALALIGMTASGAQAGLIALTFDAEPPGPCDWSWNESGCTLVFVDTTAEDCTAGMCVAGSEPGMLWLFPARLDIDFNGLTNLYVDRVEIDIHDYCGTDCTRAFLYDDWMVLDAIGNPIAGESTLVLSRSGGMPNHMAVSSCEASISEIRLYTEGVPAAGASWSTVKTLY
jgi:hypothetical protein